MANVAAVTQLMETVAPVTPASPSTSAPEHSFATVMRQANQDAGVPLAPAEQEEPVNLEDAGFKADKTGEQTSLQASPQEAPTKETATVAIKSGPAVASPSIPLSNARYTAANMLSAMLGTLIAPDGDGTAGASGAPSPVKTAPAAALITSATPDDLPAQIVAVATAKPLDLSTPVLPVSAVEVPSSQAVAKIGASPAHTSAARTKHEAPKLAEPAGAPLLASAPAAVTLPTLPTHTAILVPLPDAALPTAGTEKPAATAAELAAAHGITPGLPDGATAAVLNSPPNAANFGQSLFGQSLTVPAAHAPTAPPQATPEAPAAARPAILQFAPGNQPLRAHWESLSTVFPQPTGLTPSPSGAPAVIANTVATAGPLSVATDGGIQVQALVSQSQPQISPLHKIAAKPASAIAAAQTASVASPAGTPPTASLTALLTASSSSTGSNTAQHLAAPAAASPAITPLGDPSTAVPTPVTLAHTPLAVTPSSTSPGPTLVTGAPAAATSPYATGETLGHTMLSSTPTTLEVGVASGTHGWLKIRAELNASGTIDASLTGTNAAAAGRLHNDLPALSSFLQEERVALGSLNVAAPGATAAVLHATAASAPESPSSFTRSAAEGVGTLGAAVASDAGASGGRAPQQQQASESSPPVIVARDDDGVTGAITATMSTPYGTVTNMAQSGPLSEDGYGSGGSWLNVRV